MVVKHPDWHEVCGGHVQEMLSLTAANIVLVQVPILRRLAQSCVPRFCAPSALSQKPWHLQ